MGEFDGYFQSASSGYATCAMVPKRNDGTVDEKLIVYGMTNLPVADASIFPIITRGNPLTSVYAVGE